MGVEYHNHHQQQHNYQQMSRTTSLKMPMWLCLRPSITQEDQDQDHFNHHHHDHQKLSKLENNVNSSADDQQKTKNNRCNIVKLEPGSPKVGCMGQIKHNHGKPTFLSTNNHQHIKNNNKYFKLKKMFSSNGINYCRNSSRTNNSNIRGVLGLTTIPNSSKLLLHHCHNTSIKDQDYHVPSSSSCSSSTSSSSSSCSIVSISDLDPPLPVVKRLPTRVCNSDEISSIWKRRCGGEAALKGLQLSSSSLTNKRHNIVLPKPQVSL